MYVGCNPPRLQGYRSGLGLTPLDTALSFVSNAIGGIFSSSDPVKDALRKTRVEEHYAGAMAGDATALACLMSDAELAPQTPGCIVGSKVAVAYAKAKYAEYQVRHGAGQIGGVLIGQSDIPTQIVGTLSNPLVLGGIVLGAFLLFRKRR
jgi:hypothetical protein